MERNAQVSKGILMKKKASIAVLILSSLGLLSGMSRLLEVISARGFGGVNYGVVLFPLLTAIGAVCFLIKE